jgi:hypothetical protein
MAIRQYLYVVCSGLACAQQCWHMHAQVRLFRPCHRRSSKVVLSTTRSVRYPMAQCLVRALRGIICQPQARNDKRRMTFVSLVPESRGSDYRARIQNRAHFRALVNRHYIIWTMTTSTPNLTKTCCLQSSSIKRAMLSIGITHASASSTLITNPSPKGLKYAIRDM